MPLPPYLADKNSLEYLGYKMCVEFLYYNSDPSPASWLYYRKARYDIDLVVTVEQLGNPGTNVTVTFAGGKPIGDTEFGEDASQVSSQTAIVLPNAAREIQSICEFYDLESKPGRCLWVHPDYPADGAVTERVFQIVNFVPVRDHAVMNVSPYSFDPITRMIPDEVISSDNWNVAGVRAKYLV